MTFDHKYCVITHLVQMLGHCQILILFFLHGFYFRSWEGRQSNLNKLTNKCKRCKTLTAPISKTRKCTSPLGLTVAVLAERALHDGIQCHEAHVFKQFKSLIGVCVRLPFVLVGKNWCHTSGRRLKKKKSLANTKCIPCLYFTMTAFICYHYAIVYIPTRY